MKRFDVLLVLGYIAAVVFGKTVLGETKFPELRMIQGVIVYVAFPLGAFAVLFVSTGLVEVAHPEWVQKLEKWIKKPVF